MLLGIPQLDQRVPLVWTESGWPYTWRCSMDGLPATVGVGPPRYVRRAVTSDTPNWAIVLSTVRSLASHRATSWALIHHQFSELGLGGHDQVGRDRIRGDKWHLPALRRQPPTGISMNGRQRMLEPNTRSTDQDEPRRRPVALFTPAARQNLRTYGDIDELRLSRFTVSLALLPEARGRSSRALVVSRVGLLTNHPARVTLI